MMEDTNTKDLARKLDDAEKGVREISGIRGEASALFRQDGKIVKHADVVEMDRRARDAITSATALETMLRDLKGALLLVADDALFGRWRELLAAAEYQRESVETMAKSWSDRVAASKRILERESIEADLRVTVDICAEIRQRIEADSGPILEKFNALLDEWENFARQREHFLVTALRRQEFRESARERIPSCSTFDTEIRRVFRRLETVFAAPRQPINVPGVGVF